MEIYDNIASWTGWPPIVSVLILLIGFGIWTFNNHISLLKQQIEFLNSRLKDIQQFTPDVLASRLAERHKLLTEEVNILNAEREQNERKIEQLNTQLSETRAEAEILSVQLRNAQAILYDFELPREGKFKQEIADDITKTIEHFSAIFIPVNIWGDAGYDLDLIQKTGPYRIKVDYPGMFKMYLVVSNSNNQEMGLVTNPYLGYYEKDYYVTLVNVLRSTTNITDLEGPSLYDEQFILDDAEFYIFSPFDNSIYYLKVPIHAMG